MFKKCLSVLLSICFILTAVVVSALTVGADSMGTKSSGDYLYELNYDGTAVILLYTGPGGDVTVPSAIDGHKVTCIGGSAFSEYMEDEHPLTGITIPDTVVEIGLMAFCGCSNLSKVNIPSSVRMIDWEAFSETAWIEAQPDGPVYINDVLYTYKGDCPASFAIKEGTVSISSCAFCDQKELASVTIPEGVESIGDCAFLNCTGLKSVTIPKSVTFIDYEAFGYYEDEESNFGDLPIDISIEDLEKLLENINIEEIIEKVKSFSEEEIAKLLEALNGLDIQAKLDALTKLGLTDILGSVVGMDADKISEVFDMLGIGKYLAYVSGMFDGYGFDDDDKIDEYDENVELYEEWHDLKVEGFTICGYSGSEAERYADENGFEFVSLGDQVRPVGGKTICGDSDGDGSVTIVDATCIQRHLASLPTEYYSEKASDADGDGFVTIMDATAIQRHLAFLPTNEGIGKEI